MGRVLKSSPESSVAPKALQYKLAYCNTNWRCIVILFGELVVVGVSNTLLSRRSPAKGVWQKSDEKSDRSISRERKISPKRKFWGGYPCGHPAANFGQALQILEKEAFWSGHPARTSMKKLRSEKLRADFLFPNQKVVCSKPSLKFVKKFLRFSKKN